MSPTSPDPSPTRGPAAAAAVLALAFLVATALIWLRMAPSSDSGAREIELFPSELEAAEAWLAEHADAPFDPLVSEWDPMLEHLGAVMALRDELLARERTPKEAWALAVFGQDPAWLQLMAQETRLDHALTAVLVLPAAAEQVAQACPGLPLTMNALCRPVDRSSAERAIDLVLIRQLGSDDSVVAAHALAAACRLGPVRGPQVGATAMNGGVMGEDPRLQRLRGQRVRACTLPRDKAVSELRKALTADAELALVSATELARLDATEAAADLDALADRLGDSGDAVLVRYAAAAVRGEGADFAAEVEGMGL